MKWPNPRIAQIQSRTDLAEFLVELSEQIRMGEFPMEHSSSIQLINSAGRWTREMDGFFTDMGEDVPEEPEWALVAEIFCAALVYE